MGQRIEDTHRDTLLKKYDYRIGDRLVEAGYLTHEQRDILLKKQEERKLLGKRVRLGELAVEEGFCNKEQVESLPGYIGERLVALGAITAEQREALIDWQGQLRKDGIIIRFGELTVSEGFCTRADLELVIPHFHESEP